MYSMHGIIVYIKYFTCVVNCKVSCVRYRLAMGRDDSSEVEISVCVAVCVAVSIAVLNCKEWCVRCRLAVGCVCVNVCVFDIRGGITRLREISVCVTLCDAVCVAVCTSCSVFCSMWCSVSLRVLQCVMQTRLSSRFSKVSSIVIFVGQLSRDPLSRRGSHIGYLISVGHFPQKIPAYIGEFLTRRQFHSYFL